MPAVPDHQRGAGQHLVVIEPGVHRGVGWNPQSRCLDAGSDGDDGLDRQRRHRIQDVLKHPPLTGEGTRAEADQDSRHGCRYGLPGRALPRDADVTHGWGAANRVEFGVRGDDV